MEVWWFMQTRLVGSMQLDIYSWTVILQSSSVLPWYEQRILVWAVLFKSSQTKKCWNLSVILSKELLTEQIQKNSFSEEKKTNKSQFLFISLF